MNDEREKDDKNPHYKKDSQTGLLLDKWVYNGPDRDKDAKLINHTELKKYLDNGYKENYGGFEPKNKGGRPPKK